MAPSDTFGAATICGQCLHYADLLGRNLASFRIFSAERLARLLEETASEDCSCACEILRRWGVRGHNAQAALPHSDVWLSELPPRDEQVRSGDAVTRNERIEMLRSLRPDSGHLAKGWNLCRCTERQICAICRRLRNEEDDSPEGLAAEWT